MRDKIIDNEKKCRVLKGIRKHIKKVMFLFPSDSRTFNMLQRMSDELKAHIKSLSDNETEVDK